MPWAYLIASVLFDGLVSVGALCSVQIAPFFAPQVFAHGPASPSAECLQYVSMSFTPISACDDQ